MLELSEVAYIDLSPLFSSKLSQFYLTIPGVTEADVVAKAEIVSLSFPGWAVGGPVKIAVLVRNTGNVHLDIATKAYLYGLWGRKIGELGEDAFS